LVLEQTKYLGHPGSVGCPITYALWESTQINEVSPNSYFELDANTGDLKWDLNSQFVTSYVIKFTETNPTQDPWTNVFFVNVTCPDISVIAPEPELGTFPDLDPTPVQLLTSEDYFINPSKAPSCASIAYSLWVWLPEATEATPYEGSFAQLSADGNFTLVPTSLDSQEF